MEYFYVDKKTWTYGYVLGLQTFCTFGMDLEKYAPETAQVLALLEYSSKMCNSNSIKKKLEFKKESETFTKEIHDSFSLPIVPGNEKKACLHLADKLQEALQIPEKANLAIKMMTHITRLSFLSNNQLWSKQPENIDKIVFLLDDTDFKEHIIQVGQKEELKYLQEEQNLNSALESVKKKLNDNDNYWKETAELFINI